MVYGGARNGMGWVAGNPAGRCISEIEVSQHAERVDSEKLAKVPWLVEYLRAKPADMTDDEPCSVRTRGSIGQGQPSQRPQYEPEPRSVFSVMSVGSKYDQPKSTRRVVFGRAEKDDPPRSSRRMWLGGGAPQRSQSTVGVQMDDARPKKTLEEVVEEIPDDLKSVGPTRSRPLQILPGLPKTQHRAPPPPRPPSSRRGRDRVTSSRGRRGSQSDRGLLNGDGLGEEGITVPARGTHTATVIFLHGVGQFGQHWVDTLDSLGHRHIKYVLPSAPQRDISALLVGGRQRAWFDIKDRSGKGPEDRVGVLCAVARVIDLAQEEIRNGIPPSRILLAGFSQGGSVALNATLRFHGELAGCIAISTWLALREDFPAQLSDAGRAAPVVMMHGGRDRMVRVKWGMQSADYLRNCGVEVSFREFKQLRHDVNPAMIDAFSIHLARLIPSTFPGDPF